MNPTALAGGRVGFFLPGPRIEVGVSFQKELQEERANAFGFHFAWQPAALPLNLRSEYARSHDGSGYWIEAAYRLSQVPFWQKALRRTEIVGRGQQLFAGEIDEDEAEEYGLPDVNTRQGDFGLNYYIQDGLKASASYSRRFNSDGNVNSGLWGWPTVLPFPWEEWDHNENTSHNSDRGAGVGVRRRTLPIRRARVKTTAPASARRWREAALTPTPCGCRASNGFAPTAAAAMPLPTSFRRE